MYVTIWRYTINPAYREEFLRYYHDDGEWVKLFRNHPHYHSTELLEGAHDTFITIDRWRDEQDFLDFKANYHEAYHTLDRICEKFTNTEEHLGAFTHS